MDEVTAQVRADLIAAISSNRIILPTLPEVALQIREAAEDPRADASSMARVLANDTAISARVMRVANSPLLRAASPILDLRMAISRLGTQYTCNLAIGLAMEQMFQATSDAIDRRMRQSVPRYLSNRGHSAGESQVSVCTPLVMWPMGTSAAGVPGHSQVHISRETSPCSLLTPLACPEQRNASTVMLKVAPQG